MNKLQSLKIEIKTLELRRKLILAFIRRSPKLCHAFDYSLLSVISHDIRHALLAKAMIRERPYHTLEKSCRELPNFSKILRYAGYKRESYLEWLLESAKYLKQQNSPLSLRCSEWGHQVFQIEKVHKEYKLIVGGDRVQFREKLLRLVPWRMRDRVAKTF